MDGFILVNDKLSKENLGKIPADDRGFLFGDYIFETILALDHQIIFLEDHLNRLLFSAQKTKIPIPWSQNELTDALYQLVEKVNSPRVYLRLMVTRGSGFGLSPHMNLNPNRIIYGKALPDQPENHIALSLKLLPRQHISRGPLPKTPNYQEAIIDIQGANQEGYDDILYYNRAKEVTESSCANIFFIRRRGSKHVVETPWVNSSLLAGITRKNIISICQKKQIPILEKRILLGELRTYDEAFLSSTIKGLVPVEKIQNYELKSDKGDKIFDRIKSYFDEIRSNKPKKD